MSSDERAALTAAETTYRDATSSTRARTADLAYLESRGDPQRLTMLRGRLGTAEREHADADRRPTELAADPAITTHPDPQQLLATAAGWQRERQLKTIAAHRRRLGLDHPTLRHPIERGYQYGHPVDRQATRRRARLVSQEVVCRGDLDQTRARGRGQA